MKQGPALTPNLDSGGQKSDLAEHWNQRMRLNALQALRYTRFVTVMRRILPMLALAILGVVLAYALYPRDKDRVSLSYEQVRGVDGGLTMKRPRLSGTDVSGNPYLITADTATQEKKDAQRVSLVRVDAKLQFDGSRWANAKAGKGFVDIDAETLHLSDGIVLVTDDGYSLRTGRAWADLERNVVFGDMRVWGSGPLGAIEADTFLIDRGKRHVTLKGHVHTTLYPRKAKR